MLIIVFVLKLWLRLQWQEHAWRREALLPGQPNRIEKKQAKSSSSGHEGAVLLCKKDESGMVTLGSLVSTLQNPSTLQSIFFNMQLFKTDL